MTSLIVHAIVGLSVIGWIVASNRQCSPDPAGQPPFRRWNRWGPGSWSDYIRLMFTNPAASSASQDYTIANVILLPLFTIVDGYRRGLRRPWLFVIASLFTSFAFAFAFYFATLERQRRHADGGSHQSPQPTLST
jgi:hypothetical protein